MKALALLLIKVVGLSACILTAVAAIVVLASKLVDLGESFKDPEWMNQEKED